MIVNLLRLSILIIAIFSAISAITGLGAVFKGAYWPMVCAGVGIELGKYSLVAYAMQQWYTLNNRFKLSVVIVAVYVSLLTSIGVYGYLANAFQMNHKAVQKIEVDLTSLTAEKSRLEARITSIDQQVIDLPKEFVNGRLKLILAFDEERKDIAKSLKSVNEKLEISQVSSIDGLGELGPIVSIAGSFGASIETAVGWMILGVALALDPFALYMTLLLNRQRKPLDTHQKHIKLTEPVLNQPEGLAATWNFK